jgi:hypothetical protein
MNFNLIIPPAAETAVTGYLMGATRQIGKAAWRLEIYRGETLPRVYRNGEAQTSIANCPPVVVKFWLAFKSSDAFQYAINR